MSNITDTRKFPDDRLQASAVAAPRRTPHGGSGWSQPHGLQALRQPQDGALTQSGISGSVRSIDALSPNAAIESEDARLNGTLRSLARRVKGLNIMPARPTDLNAGARYVVEPIVRKTPDSNRKVAAHTQVA